MEDKNSLNLEAEGDSPLPVMPEAIPAQILIEVQGGHHGAHSSSPDMGGQGAPVLNSTAHDATVLGESALEYPDPMIPLQDVVAYAQPFLDLITEQNRLNLAVINANNALLETVKKLMSERNGEKGNQNTFPINSLFLPTPVSTQFSPSGLSHFEIAMKVWSAWEHKYEQLPPLDLSVFLFNPDGNKQIPQSVRKVSNRFRLFQLHRKSMDINDNSLNAWNFLNDAGKDEWGRMAYIIGTWQEEQEKLGLIQLITVGSHPRTAKEK
ncbi:hypothetical protein GCK72_007010 [Caenorhabditis remanei]|uniref:Uncharacterized protein n=1 Tax=Caenorhabditis remanei TaxID=31234 RepID=A0A6A5HML7_CAERE|nr:hypothetical protein GCK72_007010 [Caenorhabditis remanei]KAF1767052.1 hypothetical protein GCK72_007010 [Caenorhabditis remanei]